MKRKSWVTDYFSFTRKDRIGILTILALIILTFFVPKFFPAKSKQDLKAPDTAWIAAIKKLEVKQQNRANGSTQKTDQKEDAYSYQYDRTAQNTTRKLFYFDPNTLPAEKWKELGLRDYTIKTIQNYLHKGGHFSRPEDLHRIYGLHTDEYERLQPFIKIEALSKPEANTFREITQPHHSFQQDPVDINVADTTSFIALPGIGNKLALRIVNFREKLGGFYSIDQVAEIYGLADSVFKKIKPFLQLNSINLKKININTATVDELKAHPYIRYAIANPLISYRLQHGPFTKIEDLRNVMSITEEVYKKISPYLTTE